MIEKLKVVVKPEDWKLPVDELEMRCLKNLLSKVDELVDAVNELQQQVKEIMTWRFETDDEPAENRESSKIEQDPFAKQRGWVGKLCWFWDDEKEEKVCGILTTIDSDCGLSDMCPYWNGTTSNWFEHCEPVKPDDDIIYKGGDNEK